MNLFDIKGKKVVITGGTRGLGHGIAEGFMEAGAKVVIVGSSDKALSVAEEFKNKGYWCEAVVGDLKKSDNRKEIFLKSVCLLDGIDVLINCAGVQRRYACEEFPMDEWNEVLEVNLTASFELAQLAAKEFLSKEKPYGKIINIASMLSFFGGQTVVAYAASKGGVAQMTKAMCNEWASKGINVNAVAPGYMDTEMNAALTDPDNPRYKIITDRIPAKRWGNENDIKGACIFLASAASDYVDGAIIPVDGGYLVK